jgi:hypothetical protein
MYHYKLQNKLEYHKEIIIGQYRKFLPAVTYELQLRSLSTMLPAPAICSLYFQRQMSVVKVAIEVTSDLQCGFS